MSKSFKKSLFSTSLIICGLTAGLSIGVFAYNEAVSATVAQETSLSQDLKAYGFDAKSKSFTYTAKQQNANQAVFTNVKFGTEFTAASMTLSKDVTDGVKITLANPVFKSPETSMKAVSAVIIDQTKRVNGKANFFDIDGKNDFKGNFEFNGLEIGSKGRSSPIKIAKIELLGFEGSKDKVKFSSLSINDLGFIESSIKMNIGGIKLSGLSDNLFDSFSKAKDDKEKPDFKNMLASVNLGHFQIRDVYVAPFVQTTKTKTKATATDKVSEIFKEAKLGNFEIKNFNRKTLESFAFENFSIKMAMQGEPINLKLKEFSFKDLNISFYEYLIKSYIETKEKNPELANKKIIDLFKGGPLDSGISSFRFDGFEATGYGMAANIDGFNLTTNIDNEGIIDKLSMPNGVMKFGFTNKENPIAAMAYSKFKEFGLEGFNMQMQFEASFDKNTDTYKFDKYAINIDKILSMDMNTSVIGLGNYYKTTDLETFLKASNSFSKALTPKAGKDKDLTDEEIKKATEAVSSTDANAQEATDDKKVKTEDTKAAELAAKQAKEELNKQNIQAFKDYIASFTGVKFKNANITIKDLGILDIITNFAIKEKEISKEEVRKEMSAPLNSYAANKSNPAIFRELALGLSKFLNKGGSLNINLNPPAPIEYKDLIDEKHTKQTIGLSVTNSSN